MKTLTIKQPWAWLIIHGGKDIENRTWQTPYRGPLLIHAGKTIDKPALRHFLKSFPHIKLPGAFMVGGIIGVVELLACCAYSPSPWYDGSPNAWVLSNPRPLQFFAVRGQLGLFDVAYPGTVQP